MASRKKAAADSVVVKQHQQVANPRFTGYGLVKPGAGAEREKPKPPPKRPLMERAKNVARKVFTEATKPFEDTDVDIRYKARKSYEKFKEQSKKKGR